jgi:hypothetical protein
VIFSLLSLPMDGFKFVLNTIIKIAEEQWTDDGPLKEQLLELQVRLDNGEINEAQYVEAEALILRELREIQKRKRELVGAPPAQEGGLHGKVEEGSGASVTWDTGESEKK